MMVRNTLIRNLRLFVLAFDPSVSTKTFNPFSFISLYSFSPNRVFLIFSFRFFTLNFLYFHATAEDMTIARIDIAREIIEISKEILVSKQTI